MDTFSRYVESMVKRLFELLGLLTIAAGVYFVVIERTKVETCATRRQESTSASA